MTKYKRVASAYSSMWHTLTTAGRTLIYILKSSGPNMDPWGTPNKMHYDSHPTPFTNTLWVLLLGHELNHCKVDLSNPNFASFASSRLWLRVSKAWVASMLSWKFFEELCSLYTTPQITFLILLLIIIISNKRTCYVRNLFNYKIIYIHINVHANLTCRKWC